MGFCDGCFTLDRDEEANRKVFKEEIPDLLVENLLYIGAKESATNEKTLAERNIKRVIVCCTILPMYLKNNSELKYLRLCLTDNLT